MGGLCGWRWQRVAEVVFGEKAPGGEGSCNGLQMFLCTLARPPTQCLLCTSSKPALLPFLPAHSFCIATKQPECHYRPRRARRSLPSGNDDDDASRAPPPPPSKGRSFWPTESEIAAALAGGGGSSTSAGSRSGGERPSFPLKR